MTNLNDLKSSTVKSAAYDVLLQVCLRLVSFILNAFILRCVSPSVFAIMSVRLHLLYSTGLLLSREAFRRAALGSKSHRMDRLVNLIWIGSFISIPLSLLGWVIWSRLMAAPHPEVTSHYQAGVLLILCSVVIEVATEVPYIVAELQLWIHVKVMIEGAMQLSRVILLAISLYFWPSKAVLLFGLSHVFGSLVYCICYYGFFARCFRCKESASQLGVGSIRGLFFSFPRSGIFPEVDPHLWRVARTFFKQGWIKEALTEGEFYIMNFFPFVSLQQQGVYQVVNNIGSLAARLIFRSIEAAAYKFFAQTLTRGIPLKNQDKVKVVAVDEFLSSLLRNLMFLSFFVVTFGWAFSRPILGLYGGWNLSDLGGNLLRLQCVYVVFLALNGITEAFTFATMSEEQLEKHNYRLVLFSFVFVFTTVLLVYFFGVVGLILGNCFNMTLRIASSLRFIRDSFEGSGRNPLISLTISARVAFSFGTAFLVTAISEITVYERSLLGHIAVGATTGLFVVFCLKNEMKEIVVKILSSCDHIYCHLLSISPVNEDGSDFGLRLFKYIHDFLYR